MTVIGFPKQRRQPKPSAGEEKLALNVRTLYRRLCRAIDTARLAGLEVQVSLDGDDTVGNPQRVRQREIVVKRKL